VWNVVIKVTATNSDQYINNLTLIGTPHNISEIKKLLASRFPIMDLGPAKSILGVEVVQR